MKIKFLALASVALLAFGLSLTAGAGSIDDTDSDLIPDVFDNCSAHANGPASATNQVDTDGDGFGNRCDCDYFQDGFILGDDIADLFANFNGTSALHDTNGDGFVLGDDVATCFGFFNSVPGPGATAI
jgi:hypothetical protein